MSECFYDDEHHGDEEDAEDGGDGRTENDGNPHSDSRRSTGAGSDGQRDRADDEGQGRHDDRAETDLGRFDCSRYGIHAAFIDTDFGVFDDQDGILGGQADDGQQTDLEVQVILLVHEIGKDRSPEDACRQAEHDGKWYFPAFIEGSQDEEDEEDSQGKDVDRLVTGFDFFTAHATPFVGIAFTEGVLGDFFQGFQSITGAIAIGRSPLDLDGRIVVETVEDRRRTDSFRPDEVGHRHELVGAVADVDVVIGIDGFTKFRSGLDDDFEVTAEHGEVVDLIGTVEGLERRIEVAQGNAFFGDFIAVDVELIARRIGSEGRVDRTDFRTFAGSGDEFLSRRRQFCRRMAAAVFQLHRKARRRAHAVDRRRVHGDDRSLGNLIAHGHDLADQGIDGQGFIFTLIPVAHADEGRRPVRFRLIGQDTEADDVHDIGYAGLLFQPLTDLFADLFRFRLGNAFRQGDVHHDEGVIF